MLRLVQGHENITLAGCDVPVRHVRVCWSASGSAEATQEKQTRGEEVSM